MPARFWGMGSNVFLEAMACGLPVITSDVGGNAEVVNQPYLGMILPFGDQELLCRSIAVALRKPWDRQLIISYARENSWVDRVETLVAEFSHIAAPGRPC